MVGFPTTLRLLCGAVALALTCPGASASAFLRTRTQGELQQVTRQIIESTLSSELAMNSARLESMEEELRPMFSALPKNENGTLESSAVRYALHRYFVQKHGWYVKGLEPSGESWNASAPTSVMATRVPTYILSLFEQRLHGQGIGLHELAVFAATLGDFVHNEALADVMDLYTAFNVPTTTTPEQEEVDRIIQAYVLQLLDQNNTIDTLTNLRQTEEYMKEDFPAWHDFELWVSDIRQAMALDRIRRHFKADQLSLESVVEDVMALNDRLGTFQDIECKILKNGLMDKEYKNTGRVLLSDFYRLGMQGTFLFNEHVDYLRKLGALDESDPAHPTVIIPNYLASQANCLASTSFHSVCCIDECEQLLGQLERSIAAPTALPGQVAELVGRLRSDTVDAPRNLSASVLTRLAEIADHHDGRVPLHGRLFAQWMHHVYPLECPYPHEAGTATPLTADEWMDTFGADQVEASAFERHRLIHAQDATVHAKAESLPWTAVEELVVPRQESGKGLRFARKVAAVLALLGASVSVLKLAAKGAAASLPTSAWPEKSHMV